MPQEGTSKSAMPDGGHTAKPTSWRNRIDELAKFASARAALASYEGREAGANYLRSTLFAVVAIFFSLIFYLLTVLLGIVALIEVCKLPVLAALGLGVAVHALGFVVLAILAAKGFSKPAFRALREQLRKDKEWMNAGRKN